MNREKLYNTLAYLVGVGLGVLFALGVIAVGMQAF